MQGIVKALKGRGFAVECFGTKEQAAQYLLEAIGERSVGIGGSISVEQLGVYDALKARGNEAYWHWKAPEDMDGARTKAINSQVYLCSANALLCDGRLINIDGSGNRLAATLFGPEEVYFVVGRNKLVDGDLEEGIARAKNIACPQNARRLGLSTPCAVTGKCANCASAQRMCAGLLVLEHAMSSHPMHVLLVDEDLGY